MLKQQKTKLMAGLAIVIILCIVSGLAVFSLSEIPFGTLFQVVLYLFCFFLTLLMVLAAIFLFQSAKRWLTWTGLIPLLLAVVVLLLTIIITFDYRILYFQSLSPNPTKTEWIEDLHYLANQMAEKHADLYALVPEEKLAETVKEIEERIPEMTDSDIQMAFFKLAALPNDGHTFPFIMIPAYDLHSFPFKVFLFSEGLYIVDAGRGYKDLIGARILKIGSTSIEDIFNKLPLLLSAENMSSYKERFTYMVMMPEWLRYYKVIQGIDKADFTLIKRNGEQISQTIQSIKFYPHFLWSNLFPVDNDAPPVYTNYRKDYYLYKFLEDSSTLYIQFNQCDNQSDRETIDQFTTRLEHSVKANDPEKCIIDLRNNDGGSQVWGGLLSFLKDHDKFNHPGGLFVLIGRRTFSSAVIFTTQLQLQTSAILIGEPTGQGPVFYSGPNIIELPNSRLPFAVSRRLTLAGLPFDKRHAIEPDIPVDYSVSDFLEGRDPVLEAAISYNPPEQNYINVPEKILEKYTGRYLLDSIHVMDIENKSNSLQVHLTDFLSNSGFRFKSDIFPVSKNVFNTKISGVQIKFPDFEEDKQGGVILDWMGAEQLLNCTSSDYKTAFENISNGAIGTGCEILYKQKDLFLTQYPDLERILNGLGYTHLRNNDITAAIQIFRLNVDLFPESANVYDSYGEALMVNDQIDLSIQNYKKSLELNPSNKNAEQVLKKLVSK